MNKPQQWADKKRLIHVVPGSVPKFPQPVSLNPTFAAPLVRNKRPTAAGRVLRKHIRTGIIGDAG
jgi:hypothetical protein